MSRLLVLTSDWIQQFPGNNPPHNSQPFPNHSSERPLDCLHMLVIEAHVPTNSANLFVTMHQKEI